MIFSKSNASGRLRNFGAHFLQECVERLVVSTNPTLLGGDCPTNGWPGANVGTTLAEGAASRALALRCWTRSRVRGVELPARRGRRAIGSVQYSGGMLPQIRPTKYPLRCPTSFPMTEADARPSIYRRDETAVHYKRGCASSIARLCVFVSASQERPQLCRHFADLLAEAFARA